MTHLPYQKKSKQELYGQGLGEMAIDISGPIRTLTMDGFKYHQTIVLTNTSKNVGTAMLKTKNEGVEGAIEFHKYLERQTGEKLMSMRTDGICRNKR
jgi:hypothetical protein